MTVPFPIPVLDLAPELSEVSADLDAAARYRDLLARIPGLSLPFWPRIPGATQERVASAIRRFLGAPAR